MQSSSKQDLVSEQIETCTLKISAALQGQTPDWAMVLGSGMGDMIQAIENQQTISYADLPGFPKPGVGGHAGQLVVGQMGSSTVAVLQGRAHYYEAARSDAMAVAIRSMASLGCGQLLLTNAAGSLCKTMPPGTLMVFNDHIGLGLASPLIGISDDSRFVDMVNAYDTKLREQILEAANAEGIEMHQGVYAFHGGPQFETPAEIRALAVLGADAVGMSTVPECIVARHAKMRVVAVSNITNQAAGMSNEQLSHAHTQSMATTGANKLITILKRML